MPNQNSSSILSFKGRGAVSELPHRFESLSRNAIDDGWPQDAWLHLLLCSPTHSYLNLSPGLDFETQLIVKYNIADVLRKELEAKQYQPQRLNIGSATDAYQPIEIET
jgi:hypothetical protein